MIDLDRLATSAGVAQRDADSHKADVASHFLRVDVPTLFKAARQAAAFQAAQLARQGITPQELVNLLEQVERTERSKGRIALEPAFLRRLLTIGEAPTEKAEPEPTPATADPVSSAIDKSEP